jgi:hypothetical protein
MTTALAAAMKEALTQYHRSVDASSGRTDTL